MFRIFGIAFVCVGMAIAMGFGLAASAGLSEAGADLRQTLAADRVAGTKDRFIIVTPQDPVGVSTQPVALARRTPDLHVPAVTEAPRPPTSRLKATAIQSPALAPSPQPVRRASVTLRREPTRGIASGQQRRYSAPVAQRVSRNYVPQKAVPGYMIGVYR